LSKKILISSSNAGVRGPLGILRTKKTAKPPFWGAGREEIALYIALLRRFRSTALFASDFGATAADLKPPDFGKNFAEIRPLCPLGKEI